MRGARRPAYTRLMTLPEAVITPTDAGYDEARAVYNAAHDKRPVAVVRATGPDDVAATIAYARAHDLPLAVRGGGHAIAGFGTCDGGIVLDLGPMRGITRRALPPARRPSAAAAPGPTSTRPPTPPASPPPAASSRPPASPV